MEQKGVELVVECFQNGIPLNPDDLKVSTESPLELFVWLCPKGLDRIRTLVYTQEIEPGLLTIFNSIEATQKQKLKTFQRIKKLISCDKQMDCKEDRCTLIHGIHNTKQAVGNTMRTVCINGLLGICGTGNRCERQHFYLVKPFTLDQKERFYNLAVFHNTNFRGSKSSIPPLILVSSTFSRESVANDFLPLERQNQILRPKLNPHAPPWSPPPPLSPPSK
jgi:hypothetical protein